MITETIIIRNHIGLHAHPSWMIAMEAEKYESDIQILYHGQSADAKRSISILALGVDAGESVELRVSGRDEKDAAEKLPYLLKHISNA